MALSRFIIERDIPKVGTFEREQLRGAAAKSNELPWALRTGMDETGGSLIPQRFRIEFLGSASTKGLAPGRHAAPGDSSRHFRSARRYLCQIR